MYILHFKAVFTSLVSGHYGLQWKTGWNRRITFDTSLYLKFVLYFRQKNILSTNLQNNKNKYSDTNKLTKQTTNCPSKQPSN